MGIRLQKALAQAGVGSRRASEDLVRSGRVRVNGKVAVLGMVVEPDTDHIELDGLPLGRAESLAYLMLNKPRGVLSSLRSQGGRPTVRDLVPADLRLYPVGRLDMQSEGLLLMTNDGPLAQRLTHPRYGHEKTYQVLLDHRPTSAQLAAWGRGITLKDGTRFGPAQVSLQPRKDDDRWVEVVLREGQKRQVRLSAQALGLSVRRLIRTGFAGLVLGALAPGKWRALSGREVGRLRRQPERGGELGPAMANPRVEKVGNQ
ncbi:MAG: rRNA pseudouridine synthase [Anaerolineales bacterium]|nr:rRNA pseudouridine synthase [Anaerolineales bacterium]